MSDRARRRAAQLSHLYPRRWRRTYPDFVEALAEELELAPWRALGDVVRTAPVERLRNSGVVPSTPAQRSRFGLAVVFAALVPFTGLSAGMWSQLHTETLGHAAVPGSLHPTDVLLAIGTALAFVALTVGTVLVACTVRRARRCGAPSGLGRRLMGPALTLLGAVSALSACGWAADRSGWYSPAAASLPAAGPGHALTLWARGVVAAITPAWVHPTQLFRLPTLDLMATLAAPVLAVVAVAALLSLYGRLAQGPSRRALMVAALFADGAMFLATAATARWLLVGPVAASGNLAPGRTPMAVAVILGVLACTAALGTWRVIRRPEPPVGSRTVRTSIDQERSTPSGAVVAVRPLALRRLA